MGFPSEVKNSFISLLLLVKNYMSFINSVRDGVASAACFVLGSAANAEQLWLGVVNQAIDGVTGEPSYQPLPMNGLITAANRALCNREPPELVQPPFSGGQCPIRYGPIEYQWTYESSTEGPRTSFDNFRGPLRFSSPERDEGTNVTRVFITHFGKNTPAVSPSPITEQFSSVATIDPEETASFTINSIGTLGGLPDDCGDPPIPVPVRRLPTPVTVNNFNYIDNSSNVINLGDVNFQVGFANINVDGRVYIPVQVQFPDFNLDVDLNLNGEIDIDVDIAFGGGKRPRPQPTDPEVPDTPDTPDPIPPLPDVPVPEDPNEERVIIGALVTSTITDPLRASVIGQGDNPDIYIPKLGHINFLVRIRNGGVAWLSDIPVKNTKNLIPVDWPYGAVGVEGTPELGVSFDIQPVYDVRERPRFTP